ncbi:MAG: hypothetical protein E6K53_10900 [Gammaproteobacteria bacterium]|nr:MAG: hypothetical protein E6K53_10900 [Gammaproteobacteria bacterium]
MVDDLFHQPDRVERSRRVFGALLRSQVKSPQQFVATLAANAATGATLAIVPTAPLKPLTSYMAVVTNGVTDAGGVAIHPSLVYLLAKRTSPLCVSGASTIPALPAAESCALEPLRQLTNTQEAAASAAGIDASKIVISWTATTGSTYLPMKALTGLIDAAPATSIAVVPTGKDLSFANAALPPVADIYLGALTIPYYLSPPSQANPTAPLNASWKAKAGGYLPPYDKAGLDPTSTNVTFANPLPEREFGQDQACLRLAGRDLPARLHAQPHRCVRHRRRSRCGGLRGDRDRSAAARPDRQDQSAVSQPGADGHARGGPDHGRAHLRCRLSEQRHRRLGSRRQDRSVRHLLLQSGQPPDHARQLPSGRGRSA